MIPMPKVQTVKLVPGESIADGALAEKARAAALEEWRKDMEELQGIASRMEGAIAVASDPRAAPSKRREALGAASQYRERLQERCEEVQPRSQERAMQAFVAVGAAVSAVQLTSMAHSLQAELQLPAGMRKLLETFDQVQDELEASLERLMGPAAQPRPGREATALMAPTMAPGLGF